MAGALLGPLGERRPVALATCFVAWSGGLIIADIVTNAVGMPFAETPVGWSTTHAMEGLIVGLVWAVATAAIGLPSDLDRRGSAPTTATAHQRAFDGRVSSRRCDLAKNAS